MIAEIIRLIINIINWFFGRKKETADDIRLREDVELADAIKRGDSETVAQIRERRRRYHNTTVLLLLVTGLFLGGCEMMRPRKTIPLATGTAPYQLPAGDYIDTKGIIHHEDTNRWSLCEADLFNKSSPEALKPKPENEGLELWLTLIYGTVIIVGGILVINTFYKMGRRFYFIMKYGITRDGEK